MPCSGVKGRGSSACRNRVAKLFGFAFAAALVTPTQAQETEPGRAVAEVARRILERVEPGWQLLAASNAWSLAISRIAEGDEKRIAFRVETGRVYRIVGVGTPGVSDLDVCVVDPGSLSDSGSEREIACHLLPDAGPILDFTADGTGVRAVLLTAVAVDGPSAYAGIAVLTRAADAEVGIADDVPSIATLGVLTSFVEEGWDIPRNDGGSVVRGDDWGLVVGSVAVEGSPQQLSFHVEAGEDYRVSAAGEARATDLDICVFDDMGAIVACDRETDAEPGVAFTARSTGSYRAVLEPYAIGTPDLDGASESELARAGLVVTMRLADRCDAWRREPEYFDRATVLDVENCLSVWLDVTPHDSLAGTPLIHAAERSKLPEVIRLLLEIPGLDTLTAGYRSGATPLAVAVAFSPVPEEATNLLLDHSPGLLESRSFRRDDGTATSLLHAALLRPDANVGAVARLVTEMVEQRRHDLLLVKDERGDTPLHAAARVATRPVIVRQIVEGAPREFRRQMLTAANDDDRTPVELAWERKDGRRLAVQLEEYHAEYVSPSIGRRLSRLRDAVEPILASAAAIAVFLFTVVRTFPSSPFARLAHRAFNRLPTGFDDEE